MRIILVEPVLSGHHKTYLEVFVKALNSLNYEVSILSIPSALNSIKYSHVNNVSYRKYLKLPRNCLCKKLAIIINLFISILNILSVRKLVNKEKDFVFFCCIDSYMNELMPRFLFEYLFPVDFSGLILQPRSRTKRYGILSFFDKRNILKSKYCKGVAVLDEFCDEELVSFQQKVIKFPDFSDETKPNSDFDLAKEIIKKADGRKIISLLGAISTRKGIYTFVESAKKMPDYFFVIAGKAYVDKPDEVYLTEQFNRESNCFYSSENIPTEADFNMLVAISDVIYAAYLNFSQSSNMFAKVSLFDKPIIVSKGYYMEEIVNAYKLGIAINQFSIEECVKAIKTLCYDEKYVKNKRTEYLKKHSIENLNKSFDKLLKQESID